MTTPHDLIRTITNLSPILGPSVAAGAALGALLPHDDIPAESARDKATEFLAHLTANDLDRIGLAAAELHKLTSWQAAQRRTANEPAPAQPKAGEAQ